MIFVTATGGVLSIILIIALAFLLGSGISKPVMSRVRVLGIIGMGNGGRIILRRCGDVSGGNARFVPLGGSRLLQAVGKAFEKMQHQLAIIFRQTSDDGVHMVRLVEEARAAFGQQFGRGAIEDFRQF